MNSYARESAPAAVAAGSRAGPAAVQETGAPSATQRFCRFSSGVLVFTVLVIVWGAYVRATGSGAGCGEHWPLCNGEVVPRAPAVETLIELTHRLTSGMSLVLVLLLGWRAFRLFPRGHRVRRAAAASVVLILSEALIGAGLVLFGLVAEDQSSSRALVLCVHLTNTFLLLAALALCARFAAAAPEQPPRWHAGGVAAAAGVALVGCLLTGISGAIAALGDTLFPAGSLAEALWQDLSETSHVLIRLRVHHPWIAVLVGCGIAAFAVRLRARYPDRLGAWPMLLVGLVGSQLAVGFLNVALLAPVWLQLVHLALADALWIVLVLLVASALDAEAAVLRTAACPETGVAS